MFSNLKCIHNHWSITKVLHGDIKRIYSSQFKVCRSTCSIKLRTAMAGVGSPCEDVALCTPPEMGVRKRPDRLLLEFGVTGGAIILLPTFTFPGVLLSLASAFFTCTPQIQKQYHCQIRTSSDKLHTYIILVTLMTTYISSTPSSMPTTTSHQAHKLLALSSVYISTWEGFVIGYDECRRGRASPLDWHSRSSLRWAWEA